MDEFKYSECSIEKEEFISEIIPENNIKKVKNVNLDMFYFRST